MNLKLTLVFIILLRASVFAGALAQNTVGDINSLIKFINENEKKSAADSILRKESEEPKKGTLLKVTDSVPDNISDILSFLTMAETSETDSIPDNTNSILEALILHGSGPKKEVSSLTVLDFLTNAYAAHGFYQTGKWEDAEDFSYITRNLILPEYDAEDFYRPVSGRITSNYGFRRTFGRVHKGIDLALSIGDTVRAALPGVVAKVGYDAGGYGVYIVLVHNNGMETRYAHLQKTMPGPGTRIDAGEPVGLGGNSGNSTGPHLHFEIRYRGTAVDPASVFNFNVRSMKVRK